MDHVNRFESRATFGLLRAEYTVGMVASGVLLIRHVGEVRWIPALVLFSYIDLVGYIPGVIAHHAGRRSYLPRHFYLLYNVMHSFLTQAVVVALWVCFIGWEWALLVIPLHLCGDRALFGNFMKQFSIPFEPQEIPEFAAFQSQLRQRRGLRCEELVHADLD